MTPFLQRCRACFSAGARRDGAVAPHACSSPSSSADRVLLAMLARLGGDASVNVTINGGRVSAAEMFDTILWLLFLRFAVPVLGVWYGTSLIADEVEEKTITYLFVRPIRRGAVVVGEVSRLPGMHVARRARRRHAGVRGDHHAIRIPGGRQPDPGPARCWRSVSQHTERSSHSWGRRSDGRWSAGWCLPSAGNRSRFSSQDTCDGSPWPTTWMRCSGRVPPRPRSLFWLLAITAGCLLLATRAVEHREYILDQ